MKVTVKFYELLARDTNTRELSTKRVMLPTRPTKLEGKQFFDNEVIVLSIETIKETIEIPQEVLADLLEQQLKESEGK